MVLGQGLRVCWAFRGVGVQGCESVGYHLDELGPFEGL